MTTGENDGAEVARSALAKASWRILPLLAVGYCISYIDRVNISFAALQMNHALHFSATVYGLGAGLFFVTYALWKSRRICCWCGSAHGAGSPGSCSPGARWPSA